MKGERTKRSSAKPSMADFCGEVLVAVFMVLLVFDGGSKKGLRDIGRPLL